MCVLHLVIVVSAPCSCFEVADRCEHPLLCLLHQHLVLQQARFPDMILGAIQVGFIQEHHACGIAFQDDEGRK